MGFGRALGGVATGFLNRWVDQNDAARHAQERQDEMRLRAIQDYIPEYIKEKTKANQQIEEENRLKQNLLAEDLDPRLVDHAVEMYTTTKEPKWRDPYFLRSIKVTDVTGNQELEDTLMRDKTPGSRSSVLGPSITRQSAPDTFLPTMNALSGNNPKLTRGMEQFNIPSATARNVDTDPNRRVVMQTVDQKEQRANASILNGLVDKFVGMVDRGELTADQAQQQLALQYKRVTGQDLPDVSGQAPISNDVSAPSLFGSIVPREQRDAARKETEISRAKDARLKYEDAIRSGDPDARAAAETELAMRSGRDIVRQDRAQATKQNEHDRRVAEFLDLAPKARAGDQDAIDALMATSEGRAFVKTRILPDMKEGEQKQKLLAFMANPEDANTRADATVAMGGKDVAKMTGTEGTMGRRESNQLEAQLVTDFGKALQHIYPSSNITMDTSGNLQIKGLTNDPEAPKILDAAMVKYREDLKKANGNRSALDAPITYLQREKDISVANANLKRSNAAIQTLKAEAAKFGGDRTKALESIRKNSGLSAEDFKKFKELVDGE